MNSPRKKELEESEYAHVNRISQAVLMQLDPDTLMQLVVESARDLLKAETVLIPLLDKNLENYTYRAGCGKNADEIVGESLPLEFGVCGWVWKHKKAWWRGILDELSEQERNKWEKEAGTMLLVPLFGKDSFLGGIACINKTDGSEFTEHDFDLLSMFAGHVSIALDNANAYHDLSEARDTAENYRNQLQEANTRLHEANRELEKLALYDPLTALPNRTLIHDRLYQEIKRKKGSQIAVVLVDIDNFKEINDALGHYTGDDILRQIADRLKILLPEESTVGRMGGDEFGIILLDYDQEKTVGMIKNISATLHKQFNVNGETVSLHTSSGIAVYPDNGRDAAQLLKCADVAMYNAKKGKKEFSLYDPAEDDYTKERLKLVNEFKQAFQNRELEMFYQPKIGRGGNIAGVEALARWRHFDGGYVSPDFFIPVVESAGMHGEFTQWVMDVSFAQLAVWEKAGFSLSLSVNISMYNLKDDGFVRSLFELLDKHKINPENVILEITESVFMGDVWDIPEKISEISARGIRVAIDDFGTGYSSLLQLKKLKVHELKIDKSFITSMENNKDDLVIVRSTVDLGHNLGMNVVAEGVEEKAVSEHLREMGVDELQGYYYSKPVNAEQLTELLDTGLTKQEGL